LKALLLQATAPGELQEISTLWQSRTDYPWHHHPYKCRIQPYKLQVIHLLIRWWL